MRIMKINKLLKSILILSPLTIVLSGCPSLLTMLPSLAPSLVPSVNMNNINVNTNQISCYQGGLFSSDYCSIPISKFISLISDYANPLDVNSLLMYDLNNNQQFIFDNLNHTNTIDILNEQFLANYPTAMQFALLPLKVQTLYIKMRERYIPQKDYTQLYNSYIYLYTFGALAYATDSCTAPYELPTLKGNHLSLDQIRQREMLYKAFSIQYSNAVLHHIAGDVDSTYNSETDLYNAIYAAILKIDPNQLQSIAQSIFSNTNSSLPIFQPEFFSESGIKFGDIGKFACTDKGGMWSRYDYQYFGINVSGIDIRVKFKQRDTLKQTPKNPTSIINDNPLPATESH